ncbi:hypothetical protein ES703_107063 [subsurface metagenome]
MVRQCPHNSKIKCGKKDFPAVCKTCDIRRSSGQMILTKEVEKKELIKTVVNYEIKELTCPYCLFTGLIRKFYTPVLKSGFPSEKSFKCSDCGAGMRRDTLFREQSIEEFAEWMFDTMAWRRVNFEVFKVRLREMGISYQFWDHYKKYKAEQGGRKTGDREYDEYMQDMQRQMDES